MFHFYNTKSKFAANCEITKAQRLSVCFLNSVLIDFIDDCFIKGISSEVKNGYL